MINNKITVKDDERVNIQRGAIGHRSIWTGPAYKYAVEEERAGEVKATIRKVISETGKAQGSEIREHYEKPKGCESFFNTMLTPTFQKSFEVEVKEKNDDVLDMEFHHCPLLKAWQDLGFDDALRTKLCDMATGGDRNIAKVIGFDFHLGDIIADGCPTRQVRFSRKK